MPTVSTTFESQSLRERLQKVSRAIQRLQYPLSENSFDLERFAASSRHSGSTRHSISTSRPATQGDAGQPLALCQTEVEEEVDVVVIDRKSNGSSDGQGDAPGSGQEPQTSVHASEHESTHYGEDGVFRTTFLTNPTILAFKRFFDLSFQDPAKEAQYLKESWFLAKRTAIFICLFYYVTWGLLLGLYPRPWHPFDYYSFLGLLGLFVLPLLPLTLADIPSRYPLLWNINLFLATWSWAFLIALELKLCDYYGAHPHCGQKDFVGLFFYLLAMPTLSLFALRQTRVLHAVGTTVMIIFIAIALIPVRRSWIRHFFNFMSFHVFILFFSYEREKSDRRIFNLRDQLKIQYKATQKAQVAESRASDSKKRFVNYIFHEVRVPLNTALLSLQNLVGEELFKNAGEEHVELVDVLQSSLGMMEKVLNDVLDFNRMEAGKLVYASSPFDFGKVIRTVLMGLNVAAISKNISLTSELDPMLERLGDLIGDEMRLRQVLSNLTSNACKFTGSGGSVTLRTKLILPSTRSNNTQADEANLAGYASDQDNRRSSRVTAVDRVYPTKSDPLGDKVTIRMEVHDTGSGIRPQDVKNDRLFSPYVQTEIGKRQGGKGTGLGLALVRNIVQLSGGRLGLRSKVGVGSVFWVEQDFVVLDPTALARAFQAPETTSSPSYPSAVADKSEDAAEVTVIEEALRRPTNSLPHPITHGIVEVVRDEKASPLDKISSSKSDTRGRSRLIGNSSPRTPTVSAHQQRPTLVQLHTSEFELCSTPSRENEAAKVKIPRPFAPADEFVHYQNPGIAVPADVDLESPLHVLVVDDDLITRRLMARMITRLGHKVENVENGLLALELIRKHERGHGKGEPSLVRFDIVFLDNQMPVLSGVEMVNMARLEGFQTMVCGVTGNAMKEDQDEYIESGADHVLTKPVTEASIKQMLQTAKTRRAQRLREELDLHVSS